MDTTFTKYLCRVVGGKTVPYFVKYELITSLLKDAPGGAGVLLRSIFYKSLFMKIGKHAYIEQGVTVRSPHKIILEDDVFIEKAACLIAASSAQAAVHLKKKVSVGIGSILYAYDKEGSIQVGENSKISHYVQILAHGKITIGNNVLIGGFAYITSSSHIFRDASTPIIEQGCEIKDVVIEDDVWIGAHVTILHGVRLGRGSVIGAGAVVEGDIPEYSVAVGVPAKVVKRRGRQA